MSLEWEDRVTELVAAVPIRAHGDPFKWEGEYTIHITKRPHYCDRGDWIIHVEATGDSRLDGADGFPRYFFGTKEEVKKQMETWVSRREECHITEGGL